MPVFLQAGRQVKIQCASEMTTGISRLIKIAIKCSFYYFLHSSDILVYRHIIQITIYSFSLVMVTDLNLAVRINHLNLFLRFLGGNGNKTQTVLVREITPVSTLDRCTRMRSMVKKYPIVK